MITIFSLPKPFVGHFNIIQRNAIKSWTLLHPSCDIILLGDEPGTKNVAAEYNLQHIPYIERNEYGTPLVSSVFEVAQAEAKYPLLAYINADIILMSDFLPAIARIARKKFLMLGQRWDCDITDTIDTSAVDWEQKLRIYVETNGSLHPHTGVDYYVFPARLWGDIPPFAVGRTMYDNWLIWKARNIGCPVINATESVFCVHQNHERTYSSIGMKVINGEDCLVTGIEAKRNMELAGGSLFTFTLKDANWLLDDDGLQRVISLEYFLRQFEVMGIERPQLQKLINGVLHIIRRAKIGTSKLIHPKTS